MNQAATAPKPVPTSVPTILRGAWSRAWIETADGARDDTSTIVWLQHESQMVDVRFSVEQLALADRGSFDNCSLEDLRLLARNDSSSGYTVCTEPEVQDEWRTATAEWLNGTAGGGVAFQPVSSFPEPGLLEWNADGSILTERAPSGDYVEEWHRVADSTGPFEHRELRDGRELFRAGDLAVLVQDRLGPVPQVRLSELVLAAGDDRAALMALVDCEFSLAVGGTITASTLPWRIGQVLDV